MATAEYAHIVIHEDNVPMLAGTSVKVVELVMDHVAWAWDAEQIHRQYPHLTLGQIHSALAYYYDHKAEMDGEIARRDRLAEEMKAKYGPGPVRERIRAQRHES